MAMLCKSVRGFATCTRQLSFSCFHGIRLQTANPVKHLNIAASSYNSFNRRAKFMAVPGGDDHLLAESKKLVPPLTGDAYKGQHGKVGVIGGCQEYTGAPFFASVSATKVGADIVYVISGKTAALVIKGYSPELIVLPFLPESSEHEDELQEAQQEKLVDIAVKKIQPWVKKMSCLVVGPGLGDDPLLVQVVRQVMKEAREQGLPILVDGSGINIIAKEPSLVQGYRNCILTPNISELGRLAQAVGLQMKGNMGTQWQQHTKAIAAGFDGPTIVSKGPTDVISDGNSVIQCKVPSGLKRCGGLGDILAGITAAFMGWAQKQHATDVLKQQSDGLLRPSSGLEEPLNPLMACAYGGCTVTRSATAAAFAECERSMVATDVIRHLHASFKKIFGVSMQRL